MNAPDVTGPITDGRRGHPFGAAAFDLAAVGYVEEEWFISGEADCLRHQGDAPPTFDGYWQPERYDSVPYTTRLLVRRPSTVAFNGTVVAFWTNVSLGFEIYTGETPELYQGYAFVGVLAQSVGITGYADGPPQGLGAWDPDRYSGLSISNDDASYAIFSDALRAIRSGPGGPLGPLDVQRVVAFGASQSAGRLATYLNAVQPACGLADGFMLDVYFGRGSALGSGVAGLPGISKVQQITSNLRTEGPRPGSHLLRDDLDVPVFVVNSETESVSYRPVRQSDTERYRFWEVAGHAHGTVPGRGGLPSTWQRDLGISHHPMAPATGGNVLSLEPVRRAALMHMDRWLRDGVAPPVQPRLDFDGDRLRLDDLGLAVGGIRLPQVAVPTACHRGFAADGTLDLFGSTVPFSTATLAALYPSRAAYLERFAAAVAASEADGVILPGDAALLEPDDF